MFDFGRIVVGAELESEWSAVSIDDLDLDIDRMTSAKLRVGYDAGRILPYITAGYAQVSLSGEAFAMALLEAERIAVMPGSSFGTAAEGHVRVAMTVEDRAYEDALRRLMGFAARLAAGAKAPAA
jgi:arginine:pyruvate transaminase